MRTYKLREREIIAAKNFFTTLLRDGRVHDLKLELERGHTAGPFQITFNTLSTDASSGGSDK